LRRTAQNTLAVRGLQPVPAAFMLAQVDVVRDGHRLNELRATRTRTANTRRNRLHVCGGDRPSLALGADVGAAGDRAKAYVLRSLAGASWRLSGGHGPLDHFGWTALSVAAPAAPRVAAGTDPAAQLMTVLAAGDAYWPRRSSQRRF